jgi:hypothetical protein
MAENIGLGEAIAEGTNLSGEFGNPVTRGIQMGAQNQLAQMQRQQQEQAKLQKQAEEMYKFATLDEGKWNNAKNAKSFHEYAKMELPKIMNAYNSGDRMKANQLKSDLLNKLEVAKVVDRHEYALGKLPANNVTTKLAQDIYNKEGIMGFAEHNRKYPFAPIAKIDVDNGDFEVFQVADPKLTRTLSQSIKTTIDSLPKTKRIAQSGGSFVYQVDPTNPEYNAAKQKVIQSIKESSGDKILYTKDFKDFYDNYLTKNGIDYEEAADIDVNNALNAYLTKKYDEVEVKSVRYEKPTQAKGGFNIFVDNSGNSAYSRNKKYRFDKQADGSWLLNPAMSANETLDFEGVEIGPNGKPQEPRKLTMKEVSLKYIGNDTWEVNGYESIRGTDIAVKAQVKTPAIKNKTGYTNEDLTKLFGYKSPQPEPKKGKKMSFPEWKKSNPNGTPTDYKNYLKS